MTLAEFLMDRVDEDEAAARAAAQDASWGGGLGTPWLAESGFDGCDVTTPTDAPGRRAVIVHAEAGTPSPEVAAHIARHDPARVLAECAAKRRIVELWQMTQPPVSLSDEAVADELWTALEHLAAVYKDHPDYNPAWAPV